MTTPQRTALIVAGTRPEIIKLAPVYKAIAQHGRTRPIFCATGQHTNMADHTFEAFDLKPDQSFDLGGGVNSLVMLQAKILSAMDQALSQIKPDLVIVQGDTVSALLGAQAAFSLRIPVAHVEAGLRSFDLQNPFPEEGCRAMIAQITSLHFAPTRRSADNLLRTGVPAEQIFITGNTVTDAALDLSARRPDWPAHLPRPPQGKPLIVITTHRRESWGRDLAEICRAIATLHDRLPDAYFLLPVHLNPNVRGPVTDLLSGLPRLHLVDPQPYEHFIPVLRRATIALTDSGGIQEEAPTFGVPTLVMRRVTERPEAMEAGLAKLVGTDHDTIVTEVETLLTDRAAYERMSTPANPFGDGKASERIATAIDRFFAGDRPILEDRDLFSQVSGATTAG